MAQQPQQVLNPVRTSARKSFNACEWAWNLGYVRQIKPHQPKPALRFGTLVHSSLEKFYRPGTARGPHPAKTFGRLYRADARKYAEFGVYSDEVWVNAETLGVAMMKGYIDLYGKDQRYKVLATEQPFQQPVYERMGGGRRAARVHRFTYMGVLDGIWWDTEKRKLYLVDHKTAASIDSLIKQLSLDQQSTAYWTWGVDWLVEKGLLKKPDELEGLLYNILGKSMPDGRPRDEAGRALNKPDKDALVAELDRRNAARKQRRKRPLAPERMTMDAIEAVLVEDGCDVEQLGKPSQKQPAKLFERFPSRRGEHERQYARELAIADWKEMEEVRSGQRKPRKMYPAGPFGCNGCAYRDVCELHEVGADWEGMIKASMSEWDPYEEHEMLEAR